VLQRNAVHYEFHHLGIPTNDVRANARHNLQFGMHTSDSDCRLFRVQWHRFDSNSPLHPLIRSTPHVAFKVDNLDQALEGCKLLLEPYEPIEGFRVAIIEDGNVPIELIQTSLTDEEIWRKTNDGEGTALYKR
jgi:hypothetical protein